MANYTIDKIEYDGNVYELQDNKSGYITSESDPVFSNSPAAGITSSDITSWNNKVSDDHKWGDVSLNKTIYANQTTYYVPFLTGSSDTQADLAQAKATPTAKTIAVFDENAYLKSTTPSANDNSTKVATTAYTDSAISGKQDTLVSGTNIKTVNNESLLGSGNISITSGLQNLVDGSATGSVRGVGAAADGSSYTIGTYAIAIGSGTKASGAYSFAEGINTTADGPRAHAEGNKTTASSTDAHAEGEETTASNSHAHAEGYKTTASGSSSHAEGNQTTASGSATHAQNLGTIAQRAYQTALGQYNIADTTGNAVTRGTYVVIVGNGTSNSARSNALTVDWSGNVDIASGAHYKINGTNLSASDVGATLVQIVRW